jgi:hypothetical protein
MKLINDTELEFWQKVFLASIRSGNTSATALAHADEAVLRLRMRM